MRQGSRSILAVGLAVAVLASAGLGGAQELKPVQLLAPQTNGGKPLMQALKERAPSRAFSAEKLPDQFLSNLLWAAFGINRQDSGRRTAPSGQNLQEVDVYVVTADGTYVYDAKPHALRPVAAGDHRAITSKQFFVKDAPVTLVFVADHAKMAKLGPEERELYSAAGTGAISQNVYLFCASEGLATGVRASIDRPILAQALKLRHDQKILLAQTVGYPKK
jgi:SagB-type dehydrogenase family enzyme